MASLYRFVVCDNKVIYAIADNWKTARNLVYRSTKADIKSLTDISGKRIRLLCDDIPGIYSDDYIFDKYPWWECRCGCNKHFIPINGGMSARCTECGREIYLRREF